MYPCDVDHVVPDTHAIELNERRTDKHAPKRFKPSTKLNEYNDFFNLYDSLCTDSHSSGSSGDEACVVPSSDDFKGVRPDRNNDDSMTFNYRIDEKSLNVFDIDSLERVVIGCEGDGLPRRRHRRKTVKRRRRNFIVDKPLASSTVIGSPLQLQQPTKLKRKLSRKDSGISDSVTSLQTPDTSYNGEISCESINDHTFVVSGLFGLKVVAENREIIGNREAPVGSSTEFIDKVGVNCVKEDEGVYTQESFYNRYKGVPRTSTKAKLRLTPERTERTRLLQHLQTPAQAVCSLPFAKILRMFRKKRKTENQILNGNHKTCFNMTRQEKRNILNRMKHFKDSHKSGKKNLSIRTLADL